MGGVGCGGWPWPTRLPATAATVATLISWGLALPQARARGDAGEKRGCGGPAQGLRAPTSQGFLVNGSSCILSIGSPRDFRNRRYSNALDS